MNRKTGRNSREPAENRPTGTFKLTIDEKDLATGSFDAQERRAQPRQEYASNRAYVTEKERKAEHKAHKKRNRLKARKNRRIFSLVWLCMVLLVSFTLGSYLITGSNDFFAVGRSEGTVSVTIPEHVTREELSQILYEAHAINEPEFFDLYCAVTVDDEELEYFQPGTYDLGTNLDYQDIISTLQGGNQIREEVRITFPEGTTALEAAALLEENEVCSQEEFLTAINSSDFDDYDAIAPLANATGRYYKLEGYLFPDTYDFYKGEDIDSVVGKLVNNFQNRVEDLSRQIEESGMTLDQVVILASIIQREAASPQDMYDVSAVLHNRLDFGADYGIYRLECDSTMYYPYKTANDVPQTDALAYGSYDTYEIEGLPAGAICNPGLDAIRAAVLPNTDGDAANYLYFCHSADGTAYYATNAADHDYNLQLAGLR
ncbi:MAG TPA: endolytic transglycosylase MltG [Candidatus Acutalibacter pullicola]|uniref:Endolytic murein transglycosylase n=1 Tax=Candidatus Acutalibacter pullicola TaxID=2838417 RepID=A0A9D2MUL2_9FIRM|nr:endolytic transglycosylase MltG [Candidatus Acutalibacter pullicola]